MKQTAENIHISIGSLGERLAADHLKRNGYLILEMNHRRKWGEIDIVTIKDEIIRFIEVKTVSYETKQILVSNVSRGTFNPADNVHAEKLRRLNNVIQTYLLENNNEGEYQLDVMTIRMVPREKYAIVDHIENVYLG